jgi:ABC-2 type transport system permease protein
MSTLSKNTTSFSSTKFDVAYVDHDQTKFTSDLKEYLSDYANFKEIDNDALEDAFFYRDIVMIIEIPEGFTDSFNTNQPLKIMTKSVPDSSSSFSLESQMEKYLNLAAIYLNNDLSTDDLNQAIIANLSKSATVELSTKGNVDYEFAQAYYDYLAYMILALVITVMGSIMISFKPVDIVRRNNISAISNKKMNLFLIFANALLGLGFLVVLIIVSIILFPDQMFKTNGLLLMLNSFIFMISVITLSYLLVTLFDSKNVINGIGNIFSLGFSFITGVFIPQIFLDPSILTIARLIPSYWYVAANNRIVTLNHYNLSIMKPIITSYLIQFGFAIIFIILTIIISKKKQKLES